MSELIDIRDKSTTIRWKLLTGVSALALSGYISSSSMVRAEDSRPALWIELGGQMEAMQGTSGRFTAPFMSSITPTPGPFQDDFFAKGQRAPRFAFGAEGKVIFQPEDSDWVFSAGIRYGRSHTNRHIHHQTAREPLPFSITYYGNTYHYTRTFQDQAFADTEMASNEHHAILDFQAGKDVGVGILGTRGASNVSAGVRFANLRTSSALDILARPEINAQLYNLFGVFPIPQPTFYEYTMHAHAARSFQGIGPSLSWNASTALLGDAEHGELTLDWGVNAAVLFGRQKAKTDHTTQAYHLNVGKYGGNRYPLVYHHSYRSSRSRSVTVPNVGGFAGLSFRYTDAKITVGYRYDTFLNAMDTGIDAAKKSNLTFNGPYASISIGLGD